MTENDSKEVIILTPDMEESNYLGKEIHPLRVVRERTLFCIKARHGSIPKALEGSFTNVAAAISAIKRHEIPKPPRWLKVAGKIAPKRPKIKFKTVGRKSKSGWTKMMEKLNNG
jgi:N6-adenosine-specific RNA methylase IME4